VFHDIPVLPRNGTGTKAYVGKRREQLISVTCSLAVEPLYACDDIVVGTCLLTAGEVIQMWLTTDPASSSVSGPPVEFFFDEQDSASGSVFAEWICVWQCRPATPVTLVKFSSDSLLFATIGKVGVSSVIN